MSITMTQLSQRVYRRLNEPANTDIAALPDGTSTTPTLTSLVGVIDAYNEVAGELCRTCIPLYCTGSISSYTIGQATFQLSSLSSLTSGFSAMWAASEVSYNGSLLSPVGLMNLLNWLNYSGGIEGSTSGTPAYWADMNDTGTIVVNPRPSGSYAMSVTGLGIPTVASSGSDTTAWLPDDLLEVVECRICSLIAQKAVDDATMDVRIGIWDAQYNKRRMELWNRIDPFLRNWRYPTPPVLPVATP